MKQCICCGTDFEPPTGEDVHPPAYEYCTLCIRYSCYKDESYNDPYSERSLPVGPSESAE